MKVQPTDQIQPSAEDVPAARSAVEESGTPRIPDGAQSELQAQRTRALDELTALSEDMGLFR
jgi:hypothetical protein